MNYDNLQPRKKCEFCICYFSAVGGVGDGSGVNKMAQSYNGISQESEIFLIRSRLFLKKRKSRKKKKKKVKKIIA